VVFGRRHIAPLIPAFSDSYPDLQVRLQLSDRMDDLVKENVDVAIRIADLPSSTLMARKLTLSRRVFCAAPSYLEAHGAPEVPADLLDHQCLLLRFPGSTQFQWTYVEDGSARSLALRGRLDSDNGDVLRQWALQGQGIVMKDRWEVDGDIREGRLQVVLLNYPPPPVPISAVYPPTPFLPPRSRLFIDYLSDAFRDGYWEEGTSFR